jgi:hypothetical protein
MLNIFNETTIDLREMVLPEMVPYLDGRSIMLLLDAYLKSKGMLANKNGLFEIDNLSVDLRYNSNGKVNFKPSYTKGVGRSGLFDVNNISVDLFYIVTKEGYNLKLRPYMPSRKEFTLCLGS